MEIDLENMNEYEIGKHLYEVAYGGKAGWLQQEGEYPGPGFLRIGELVKEQIKEIRLKAIKEACGCVGKRVYEPG